MAASSRRGSTPIAIGSCHATSIIPHRDFPSEFDALWRQTLSVAQSLRHRRMPCHAYYTIFSSKFEVQHSKIHIKMLSTPTDLSISGQHLYQPFKEPIITPLTKCFCTKGYNRITGKLPNTMIAYFNTSIKAALWL